MRRLVEHLRASGHRRFLLVAGDPRVPTLVERRPVPRRDPRRRPHQRRRRGRRHGEVRRSRRGGAPERSSTCVIASSTPLAVAALECLRDAGLDVRAHRLRGVRRVQPLRPVPACITTVRQPAFEMGVPPCRSSWSAWRPEASPRTLRLTQRLELRSSRNLRFEAHAAGNLLDRCDAGHVRSQTIRANVSMKLGDQPQLPTPLKKTPMFGRNLGHAGAAAGSAWRVTVTAAPRARRLRQGERRRRRGRQDHHHALDAERRREDRRPRHLGDRPGIREGQPDIHVEVSGQPVAEHLQRSPSRLRATRSLTSSGSTRRTPRRCSRPTASWTSPILDELGITERLPESTVANYTVDGQDLRRPLPGPPDRPVDQQQAPRRQRPDDADDLRRPPRGRQDARREGHRHHLQRRQPVGVQRVAVPGVARPLRLRGEGRRHPRRLEKWDNPDFIRMYEHIAELRDAGAVRSNVATQTYPQAVDQFLQGKAAFLDAGVWAASAIQDSKVGPDADFWRGPDLRRRRRRAGHRHERRLGAARRRQEGDRRRRQARRRGEVPRVLLQRRGPAAARRQRPAAGDRPTSRSSTPRSRVPSSRRWTWPRSRRDQPARSSRT